MNHDLAAVLDYLDQRFGTSDRQAFEQRLDQEPQLRELLEKTKTMQRNLRSIFGQSERLAAPSHNIKRLTKLSTYKHTLNALLIVVVLLGGMYLAKRTNADPAPNHDALALAMADHMPDTPEQQLLLIKGVDREQNHFVRAMHADQQMWQANNVEALIIANNGDRVELSKHESHYLLSRKSSDEQPIWQQSLPYEPDSSTILGLYSSPDQAELYLSAYAPSQANQTANFNQAFNIIPKQQLNSQQSFAYAVPVESNSNSIYDIPNSVSGSSGELPLPIGPITGTVDAMQGSQQGQESFGRVIELKQQNLIIDADSGAIKPATSECTCRYLESNTILYRYDQGLPFSDYLDYEISPANPNLLTLLTADQQVLTYDLQQHKTINSTKLELEQQLNQNLHRSMQFEMFGFDSSNKSVLSMADVQISGNQQTIIIRDSDSYSTTFYAFDRQSGKQVWQNSILQTIDSFTTNWDGSMVYAIDANSGRFQGHSTFCTVSASETELRNYEHQRLEEIHMIYDF
ncbi:PQQ-like beta-propeller repeat protein [Herpetosiphon giganteus]|uniref:PQQ-like beta-propeller repeat protein n=1 Tax=Herpetosiphon giganteus TaxID=2029754 RepID=UPI001959BA20|nr:PQQ-like beta-propeller repeat protein [Herpetosiphon giganteus]MBM7843411.1 hypothetical protein [Herpetosiphon giganteus]